MRTVPAPQQTAAEGSTTYFTTIWRIKRTDGVRQYFTSHDQPLEFAGNTYIAAVGYDRTDLSNSSSLSVDNIDVRGLLDANAVSILDLQGGRYNHAEVVISRVDWRDPDTYGETIQRAGWFGEIQYDENTQEFTTELRGLTQAYQQGIVGEFGESCPYDVGDPDCNNAEGEPKNPLVVWADEIEASTAYAVDDCVRVRAPHADLTVLHAPGVTDANDDSQYGATGTLGADTTAADTTRTKNLAGNFRCQPANFAAIPSTSFIEYADADQYNIGNQPFTLQGWFYFETLGDGTRGPVLACVDGDDPTGTRSWSLLVGSVNETAEANRGKLIFSAFPTTESVSLVGALFPWVPEINRWYHVALTRDNQMLLRGFINGRLIGEPVPFAYNIPDATTPLRLGARTNTVFGGRPFEGSIEDFRLDIGEAFYREEFTPPGALPSSATETRDKTVDYGDEYYRCTVAGTTGTGDPPSFGTATFVAENANRVAAQVLSVTSRSQFTIGPPDSGGLLKGPTGVANGGAESGALVPWVIGQGEVMVDSVLPDTGSYNFTLSWPSLIDSRMDQTIDVSAYAAEIDAGGQTCSSTWRQADGNNVNTINVIYDYLDSGGALISTYTGPWSRVNAGGYVSKSDPPTAIPVGTRKIVFKLFHDVIAGGLARVDNIVFTTTLVDTDFPDDAFNFGTVAWDSGYNAGPGMDVKDYDSATKLVTLFEPMPYDISVGDTLGISIGCNREFSDCNRLGNQINFGGFKDIPGDDEYFRVDDAT